MVSSKHLTRGSPIPNFLDDGLLRIYSMRYCPYAHRAHLVLNAKKVLYHTIFINLSNKPEWLIQKSPLGKVPALELTNEPGNPSIFESLIISEYLDEKYPENRLLPNDPLQKACDRMLIEQFTPVISSMYQLTINGIEGAPATAWTTISNGFNIYEKEITRRGTPFFGGPKPGMLDYMIWPWFERHDMLQYLIGESYVFDKERNPNLAMWRDMMLEDPAVKSFYLDGETHAKFIRTRRTGTPDYDMDM